VRRLLRASLARELLWVTAGLSLLGGAVYGPYLWRSGFISDDWGLSAAYRYGAHAVRGDLPGGRVGPMRGLGDLFDVFGERLMAAPFFAFEHGLFGLHAKLHLATAVALAVAVSVEFYALLRTVGLERRHAMAPAALALVFPFSDATRLWATGAIATLGLALFLAGALLTLHALRRDGRRALAWHAAGAVVYALSVLTYQLALGLLLFMPVLYACVRDRGTALRRFGADLVVVVPTVLIASQFRPAGRATHSVGPDRVLDYIVRAGGVLGDAALPVTDVRSTPVLAAVDAFVLAILVAGAVVAFRSRRPTEERDAIRRWLSIAGLAATAIPLGYLAILPATESYVPYAFGIGNRVNLAASLGYVTLVYATLMVGAIVLAGWRHAPLVASVAVIVLLGAYVRLVHRHADVWQQAYDASQRVLTAVRGAEPAVPKGGVTLYTTRHPTFIGEVPVFFEQWDLRSAAKVVGGDPSLRAFPLPGARGMSCGPQHVELPRWGLITRSRYDRAFVVDVARARTTAIGSRRRCRIIAFLVHSAAS
jgi:hypothetical protein